MCTDPLPLRKNRNFSEGRGGGGVCTQATIKLEVENFEIKQLIQGESTLNH